VSSVLAALPAIAATAATLARAAVRREDRAAWLALGLGLLANAAGGIYLAAHPGDVAFPSGADVCFLAFFPAAFAAALLFARARLQRFGAALWLDAAIGALGAAAVVTQLLAVAIRREAGTDWITAVTLAFPMGDVLLLVMVVVALTLRGGRVSTAWLLLAAAMLARVATDAGHILPALGDRHESSWVPVTSVVMMAGVAVAAWWPYAPPRVVVLDGWRTLVTPSLLALLAGALLVLDHFHQTTDAAVWLSAATLVVVLIRMAFTFVENFSLHASRALALTDELTGLANRRHFDERLRAALDDRDGPLAVAMIDLDRFKELNDTLGHHAGDRLLAQLGGRLSAAVDDAGLVARLGGDEFALLLPGAGIARATEVGRRLGIALQPPFEIDGLEVVMDASIGAALCPEHGTDADGLLQRADVAMYQAKEARTGFQAYDPARDRHSRERLTLIAELRHALERDELVLHYQPKVDLATGRVVGVEALVRWQHPVHGLRGPGAFLPHAEHTALMRPLTLHVLETALSQLARWRADGLDLHVAVNLAVQNLLDQRTPAQIAHLLARYGLPAHVLTLEVTESLMLADPQRAGEVLADLKELGAGLALDDFGTGYSSLEHLKRLPVNELKIDRSFVMGMDRDGADRAIVASTAGLGRSLGLRVVAEGVESAASASVLAAIGCDQAQGFYYSPPVPADQIPALVRAAAAGDVGVATVNSA
jgi:diguanylate cyclase (GGDEF)-like protein